MPESDFSPTMRLVITAHEARIAEDIVIPVYNWKIQRYVPQLRSGDCVVREHAWQDHVNMLSQPETLSSDELVEVLESWKLTDGQLRPLRIVKEWESSAPPR